MADKYNGWTNYETWNVALWLDNDEDAQNQWTERAKEVWEEAEARQYATRDQAATYQLAEELNECIAGALPPDLDGMYADLLNAALSEVNWDEIAGHYIEEVDKEEDTEEELAADAGPDLGIRHPDRE